MKSEDCEADERRRIMKNEDCEADERRRIMKTAKLMSESE